MAGHLLTLRRSINSVRPRRGPRDHAERPPAPWRATAVWGGAPYSAPPAGVGGNPAKKRNWISVIVLVVLFAGLGIFAYLESKTDVVNAEAGDCVHVNSITDFDVVDCAAAEAQYKVV